MADLELEQQQQLGLKLLGFGAWDWSSNGVGGSSVNERGGRGELAPVLPFMAWAMAWEGVGIT
uniref:Uncharacterized protein n=1 Tax=Oryza brachyantha TaxID=4533 RepID=J3N356_ORYBR